MVRESNIQLNQLQSTISSLQSELMSLKSRNLKEEEVSRLKIDGLEKKLSEVDRWSNIVRDLEDIPGVRTPRWYEVDVTFDQGDTQLRFNSAEISPDGPFVITQMQPYYTYTQDTTGVAFLNVTSQKAVAGRTVPCSAFPFLLNQLGGVTAAAAPLFTGALIGDLAQVGDVTTATPTPLNAIPEFSFQIEIAGSGRFWTNRAIPAAAFYGESNPLYSGIAGWVERTDRIVVHCTPDVTIPIGGRVRMVFHGYQILGHVNIGQALGY
tara:strand:- start:3009 stop:3806 length:798 start_codon:yes stop_codon:yes gene_type:complete